MDENIGGELTFRMIWQKIKLSAVRIIVYALIAVILTAGVIGVCNIFMSNSQFETKITYYYSGVEAGEDPWGGQMDFVSGIKSPSNVEKALRNCKYTDEEVKNLVDPVIKNLTVSVDMSNASKNADEIITSAQYNFRIILSQSGEIDALINSKNDYTNIVSAITANYIESFKAKYSYNTNITAIESTGNNYIIKYNNIKDNLNRFVTEVSHLNSQANNFISSEVNLSFASLLAQANIVNSKVENFKSFILTNSVNTGNEQQQIKINIENFHSQMKAKEQEIEQYQIALDTICNVPGLGSGSNGSIIITNPDYEVLLNKLMVAISEKSDLEAQYNEWVDYGKYYGIDSVTIDESGKLTITTSEVAETDQSLVDKAKELEDEIIAAYNGMISSYHTMITEYNQGYNVQNLVRQTSQAQATQNSPITLMVFIIVEAVVFVIAVIVAMAVTSKKGQMVLRKSLNIKGKKDNNDDNKQ